MEKFLKSYCWLKGKTVYLTRSLNVVWCHLKHIIVKFFMFSCKLRKIDVTLHNGNLEKFLLNKKQDEGVCCDKSCLVYSRKF